MVDITSPLSKSLTTAFGEAVFAKDIMPGALDAGIAVAQAFAPSKFDEAFIGAFGG